MYDLVDTPPDVAAYCRLRQACGLSEINTVAATIGLAGSWFAVTVRCGEKIVCMGRIVGDGGCFLLITDIAVHPEHQGRGIGRRIMQRLMDHIESAAPKSAFVYLFADGEADKLYEQFGFRLTAPHSRGMMRRR